MENQKQVKGKVWLVGAGPSDIGLFTIKGKQVLEQAEVVVYDALVSPEILALIPAEAECINVGKRASCHIKKQEETNQILLEEVLKGKRVVRLKGGDPFLFGRGGEELELLSENGIPFEVVPGVTSAISVPAYNGIPVTHRSECSSVHIITGHKKKDEPLDMDFEALVRLNGTLVFLMGVAALPDICRGLMAGGMPGEMPAALLQQGTTAGQKRIVATVATLEEEVNRQGAVTPAIIVVGQVCRYSEKFAWEEKLPLFGCRVIVTRPKERSSGLAARLRAKGAEVLELPSIATVPRPGEALTELWEHLPESRWIAFTSPAGVRFFFEALAARNLDIRSLADKKFAALGSGTAKELKAFGILADAVPEVFDGASLGKLLAEICGEGENILLPRASLGGQEILSELSVRKDLKVFDIPIYDTVYQESPVVSARALLEEHPDTFVIFTSASTVKGFTAVTSGLDYTKVHALCIGRQTAAEAEKFGMKISISEKATIDSLVKLTENVFVLSGSEGA